MLYISKKHSSYIKENHMPETHKKLLHLLPYHHFFQWSNLFHMLEHYKVRQYAAGIFHSEC